MKSVLAMIVTAAALIGIVRPDLVSAAPHRQSTVKVMLDGRDSDGRFVTVARSTISDIHGCRRHYCLATLVGYRREVFLPRAERPSGARSPSLLGPGLGSGVSCVLGPFSHHFTLASGFRCLENCDKAK